MYLQAYLDTGSLRVFKFYDPRHCNDVSGRIVPFNDFSLQIFPWRKKLKILLTDVDELKY